MTDDQRRDHDVRGWIQSEAPDHAPEHLRTTVRSGLAQTRQERGAAGFMRRGWLRSPGQMAAAAVLGLALVVVAAGLLGNRSQIANPGPTPIPTSTAPSASPLASSSPLPTPSAIILSGSARTTDVFTPTLRFTAPAG